MAPGRELTVPESTPWWAVRVRCHPDISKAVLWRLRGPGHRACAVSHSEERVEIWAYITAEELTPRDLGVLWLGLHLDAANHQLPNPEIEWTRTDDWDWPESVKQRMVPRDVGRRLVIIPPWAAPPTPVRIPIRLDSRFGFGAGALHHTTRLCLEALERRLDTVAGSNTVSHFADIGCGSGVLSIAALQLGVARAYAVDTKAAAVRGTRKNRELNEIDPSRLMVEQGSVSDLLGMLPGSVDGFVCNILTRIIVHLIPRFNDISGASTWAILSGIRENERPYVDGALGKHGWRTTGVTQDDGWCCLEIGRV